MKRQKFMRSRQIIMDKIRFTIQILVIFLLFCWGSQLFAKEKRVEEIRHILLVNSYGQRMTWVKDILKGIEEVLKPDENNIVLHIENMDSKIFNSEKHFTNFRNYLQFKYQDTKFDLIFSSDDNAYDFLRKYRDKLFPGIPALFCGVNNFFPEQLIGLQDFTGVTEILSIRETVELILKLHPDTEEIFVINDYLKTGRGWAQDIRNKLHERFQGVKIRYSNNLPTSELMKGISELRTGNVVLLGAYFSGKNSHIYTYEKVGAMLSESSKVPVYCLLEFNIGKGVVGGDVISSYYQGKMMAEMGRDILGGKDPDEIPVKMEGSNSYIFDYRSLQRFGISEGELPQGSIIVNRSFSFYNNYKSEIWVVITAFCLLLMAFFIAYRNYLKAHYAKKKVNAAHRKLKDILDAASLVSIISTDMNGMITSFNNGAERMLGYSSVEMIGKQSAVIIHLQAEVEKYSKELSQKYKRPVKGFEVLVLNAVKEGFEEREWNYLCKDGRKIQVNLVVTAIRDEDENVTGFLGIAMDITERKEVALKLRNAQKYISNIIDSMPSILVGVDIGGKVTQWNKAAEIFTGISSKQARGEILSDIFPLMAGEMKAIRESIKAREVKQHLKRSRLTAHGGCYEDVTIYPLIANGEDGAVIRIDDVTEKVNMEAMMVQNEKMLSVGGLAAGMAHEINNPLAGMMQTASVMTNRLSTNLKIPANEKAAEAAGTSMEAISNFMEARGILQMLTTIVDSGQRVAEIISNMLSFARKSDSAASSHDLGKLLDKAVELAITDYDLKKHYDFKLIKIVKEYAEDVPLVVCEASKIQQVLLNLLRNGSQAMHEGGIEKPTFFLRTFFQKERQMVCVELEDNGPGMDEKIMKRIFDPFFTTKPEGVGTGLGLSVSYFIITEDHQGEMRVESAPGRGAKFTINLPLQGKKGSS